MTTQRMMRNSLLLAIFGAVALVGCKPTQGTPEPVEGPARIVSFTTSATVVNAGQTVLLKWETAGATAVELREVDKGVVSGVEPSTTTGELEVIVNEDALYVLEARNARGLVESAAVRISVRPGARNVMFVATPGRISYGEAATLSWLAKDAKQVALVDDAGNAIDVGAQRETGSVLVRPQADTVYTLTVDGNEYTAAVSLRPVVGLFAAAPEAAMPGEPLTVVWQTSGAKKLTLSQGGVGTLHTETDLAKVADGSFELQIPSNTSPAQVLSFELRAEGTDSAAVTVARQTVYVAGAPKVRVWKVPEYARRGGSFEVSWETSGADVVEVLENDAVIYTSPGRTEAAKHALTLAAPDVDTVYTLRARDLRGGVDLSDARNVNPVDVPSVLSFSASPKPGIAQAGDPVTLTWNAPSGRKVFIVANGEHMVHAVTGIAAETGSVTVYPTEDTTFTLTADNGLGDRANATDSVTVDHGADFTWTPAVSPLGTSVELTGTTISGNGPIVGMPFINQGPRMYGSIEQTGEDVGFTGWDTEINVIPLKKPFSGVLFGVPFTATEITVSTNGWFAFGSTSVRGPDDPTGNGLAVDLPPGAIAPFFDDLVAINGRIYIQQDQDNGEDRFIIEWSNVQPQGGPFDAEMDIQAQVYASGKVVFGYGERNSYVWPELLAPEVGIVDPFGATAEFTEYDPLERDVLTFFEALNPPFTMEATRLVHTARVERTNGHVRIRQAYPYIEPDQFIISEINPNPAAGVVDGQWIELTNKTNQPISLAGWELDFGGGATHTIGAATIPANGQLVLGQSANAGDGINVGYVYGNGLSIAAGESVKMKYAGGTYTTLPMLPGTMVPGYSWQLGTPVDVSVHPGVTEVPCAAPTAMTYGAFGQHGTPGGPNPACPSYLAPASIPGNFEYIAATGTELTFGGDPDEGAETVTPPIPFNVMHTLIPSMTVVTNGFITPYALSCPMWVGWCYNDPHEALDPTIPPYGVIAPYWDDLVAYSGGIYWESKDPDNTPATGDEYTIISWEGVPRYKDWTGTELVTAQVKFFANGNIEFHYGELLNPGDDAVTTFEDPISTSAWVVNAFSSSPIPSHSGIRFTLQ